MEFRTKAKYTDEVTALELANKDLSYQAATEAIVLRENKGILPLQPGKIALYGAGAGKTMSAMSRACWAAFSAAGIWWTGLAAMMPGM